MKLPEGKSRLDLVRQGLGLTGLAKRGRLVVSLDRLREDPRNERKSFANMEGLISSVQHHGIIEPITVTPDGDCYRILTGHRRFRAARARPSWGGGGHNPRARIGIPAANEKSDFECAAGKPQRHRNGRSPSGHAQ